MPANCSFDHAPTVNDLAKLLADAMYRPLSEDRQHRPASVLLRRNPEWDELLPQLHELGIEVTSADALPAWTEAAKEFGVQTAATFRGLVAKAASKTRAFSNPRSRSSQNGFNVAAGSKLVSKTGVASPPARLTPADWSSRTRPQ